MATKDNRIASNELVVHVLTPSSCPMSFAFQKEYINFVTERNYKNSNGVILMKQQYLANDGKNSPTIPCPLPF